MANKPPQPQRHIDDPLGGDICVSGHRYSGNLTFRHIDDPLGGDICLPGDRYSGHLTIRHIDEPLGG